MTHCVSSYNFFYVNSLEESKKNDYKKIEMSMISEVPTAKTEISDIEITTQSTQDELYSSTRSQRKELIEKSDALRASLDNYRKNYTNSASVASNMQYTCSSMSFALTSVLTGFENILLTSIRTDGQLSLMQSKIDAIILEFQTKLSLISSLAQTIPMLSELKDNDLSEEAGLEKMIDKLLKNMAATNFNYKACTNEYDLQAMVKESFQKMFGEEFTSERIDEKIKVLEDKNKSLELQLAQASSQSDKKKYTLLVKSNSAIIDILKIMKKSIEGIISKMDDFGNQDNKHS